MAGRGTCRRTAAAGTEGTRTGEERQMWSEVPMCRHAHPLPADRGTERQLCELQRLMCEQNQMLSQLLQAVRQRNG